MSTKSEHPEIFAFREEVSRPEDTDAERTRQPGWRPEPSGVGLSTTTLNPDYARRGMTPSYTEPVGQDGGRGIHY